MFENVFEVAILIVTGLLAGILISWLYWRGQISEREDRIEDLEASVEGKDGDLKNSERRLKENKSVIENLSAQLRQLEDTVHDRTTQIREKENSIEFLKGEAANLEISIEEKEREIAALEARTHAMQDNFAILDGIGPKVSEVLRSAGVNTFAKLATTDEDEIRGILVAENPNLLRLTDPSTWQEQAGLASEGDWEALSSLQESLKEGRRARAGS
jgi:predicted flap endonuclease-1-like 5' DNA nuclease